MNKVPAPTFDDAAALQALANNRRVGSYPHLQIAVLAIQQGYSQYGTAGGDAFSVQKVAVSDDVRTYLKGHYKDPPRDLEYITELRSASEHLCCPMCGSMHSGTLDHMLPKNTYGEFAVFSLNLVPACKCNSKRQETLTGANPGERVLHPYFDNCLSERLIAACFEDLGLAPRIGLRLVVPSHHSHFNAIRFHVRSIVERTAIKNYLIRSWSNLCRKPGLIVRALARNPASVLELKATLAEELSLLDDQHGSKNNWASVFVAGLLDDEVCNWLFQQLNAPGRAPDAPLIY